MGGGAWMGIEEKRTALGMLWLAVFLGCGTAHAADSAMAQAKSSSPCVRMVEDRATGVRWRVEAQGGGRPNRWVRVDGRTEPACGASGAAQSSRLRVAETTWAATGAAAMRDVGAGMRKPVAPVIQVGERIVLVQSGAAIEARFPAVALAAAAPGRPLLARLEVGNGEFGKRGGRVVEATAVGKGLARWDGQTEQNGAGW